MSVQKFTGNEIISDILLVMPEARDVLAGHGLACVNCAINEAETLAQGMGMHGFDDKKLQEILADLNFLAEEQGLSLDGGKKSISLTFAAESMIKTFQKAEQMEGFGLKIEVFWDELDETSFFLDFMAEPEANEDVFHCRGGIKVFANPKSASYLTNCEVDYDEDNESFIIAPKV